MDGREQFLRACISRDLLPRRRLVLRNAPSTELSLSHQGIGDGLGGVFASCLPNMPMVRHLSLADNRLTDDSLESILGSIIKQGNIESVDLSDNVLNQASIKALGDYLGTPGCTLKKLVLSRSDVDDAECARFVRKISANPETSLVYFDLSHNSIGMSENMNFVQPDFETGGEALAEWMRHGNCQLKYLDLSWNAIRAGSAVELG